MKNMNRTLDNAARLVGVHDYIMYRNIRGRRAQHEAMREQRAYRDARRAGVETELFRFVIAGTAVQGGSAAVAAIFAASIELETLGNRERVRKAVSLMRSGETANVLGIAVERVA